MSETVDGRSGMVAGSCPNRAESSPMSTTSKSLVLVNYFRDAPDITQACKDNSDALLRMVNTCYDASSKRWPNFIAVDFYKVWITFKNKLTSKNYVDAHCLYVYRFVNVFIYSFFCDLPSRGVMVGELLKLRMSQTVI